MNILWIAYITMSLALVDAAVIVIPDTSQLGGLDRWLPVSLSIFKITIYGHYLDLLTHLLFGIELPGYIVPFPGAML